ncbi:hypothetical protein FISHEDRAFT_43700 [Fistulina hepatica ATCC 64428]|uniref:Uncharacterized protein n=1 Tax=Fistulina hepatica ATCC 64428 TaxID=1128425 RepID=A0A0D7AD56_9AGAR|nr:hypothetical protein FISHEDRAFT_43700 [Fistulina hepatica ATCC 64428]
MQVLLFVPWCIVVGACILMCPQELERVAFNSVLGYMSPPHGIRRFAHWTEYAMTFVLIFAGALGHLLWWNSTFGLFLLVVFAAQTILAWQDFKVDLDIPLGDDDQQSIYLAFKYWALGFDLSQLRKTEDGIYLKHRTGDSHHESDVDEPKPLAVKKQE